MFLRTVALALLLALPVAAQTAPPLGAGLEGITYYATSNHFADTIKSSNPFGTVTDYNHGNPPKDAQGWPTSDFGVWCFSLNKNAPGTYSIAFTGQATVKLAWPYGNTLPTTYNASTNTSTAAATLPAGATDLQIIFTDTRRTASSAVNTGLTNLRVLRPGYSLTATPLFTTPFVNHLKRFNVIRMMDFTNTNNNDTVRWADRTPVSIAQPAANASGSARNNGLPWEYAIDLANAVNRDMWINIPAKADDDYVRQLALLIKKRLHSNLNVYVEYSNEVWNSGFTQTAYNGAQASADTSLHYAGEDSSVSYLWSFRRVGRQIKRVGDIFCASDVFGAAARNTRIRPILSGQWANPDTTLRVPLEDMEKTYGPPAKYIYGIAVAPYYTFDAAQDTPGKTKDDILRLLSASVDALNDDPSTQKSSALAAFYKIKLTAYEAGPDVSVTGNNMQAKADAFQDPRMTEITQRYLTGWYAQGGDQINYFVAGATTGNLNRYGYWGLGTDMATVESEPRTKGVDAVLNAPLPALRVGFLLPDAGQTLSILPKQFVGNKTTDAGQEYVPVGQTRDYLLRAGSASKWTLRVSGSGFGGAAVCDVYIDDARVASLSLPSVGTTAAPVSVSLAAGLHTLRCVSASGAGQYPGVSLASLAWSR